MTWMRKETDVMKSDGNGTAFAYWRVSARSLGVFGCGALKVGRGLGSAYLHSPRS